MSRSIKVQTITGYILANKEDDDVENEDEEEEIQTEFLDMKEVNSVSSGGKVFKFSVPASKEVSFMANNEIEPYKVKGRFHLCDPWWEVTCTVRRVNKHKFSTIPSSYPSYSVRTNLSSDSEDHSLVPLFLKACGAKPGFVTDFMKFLSKNVVELINVLDVLQDFEDSALNHKAAAQELKSNLMNSVAWTHVIVARKYPQIMKYLPTLLPGQFMDIISNGKMKNSRDTTEETPEQQTNTHVLEKLEQLIKTDVWKLGFHYIMFREFHMIRCEAKLEAFKVCNLLSRMTGEQRNGLELYAKLKDYCRDTGSTYIEQNMLLEKMQQWKIEDAGFSFLHKHDVLKLENKKVALHNFFSYEKGIAECLRALIEGEPWVIDLNVRKVLQRAHDDLNHSAKKLDEDQVRAAEMMCANPVTVISGKGGCGKTTLVCLVFKMAMEKQTRNSDRDEKPAIEVLLTAPTGRATSVLTKRTGCTAYTLHQVLWSFMNRKKQENGNLQEWKFSKVRVLVVDEGSLVSVQMLHSVLSMLTKHAELQKFIFLGDVRQLPSIEPGNTLYDLFEGFRKVRWAIEMRTNHRSESELIVRNAGLISEMGKKRRYNPVEFDATINMTTPSTVPSDKSFIFVQISENDDALQEALKFLLKEAPGLEDHKSSQIVAFMRRDCQLINELCCKHYSHHVTKTHENKIYFEVGDKVCCTKNGYISEADNENMEEEHAHDIAGTSQDIPSTQRKNEQKQVKKERMCNGEIFFIKADVIDKDMGARCKTRRYLTLDDENGRVVTSNYSELQKECKLCHAWARTIHTFQGSEAETIVYVLGNTFVQNWQHVYTAVTRGQKRVYVVGRERDLARAIEKRITPRNTRLRGRVKEIVAQLNFEDSFTQSDCSPDSKRQRVN
ncbi:DNA helicase B-like [Carassius auratus]|uniref:DNA helicase B-like n=1 Tax=Carassius auratus TaxID=7957 RepID=A0A6P6M275_CARAU|nr:DNA helicase B-like [Carassius auratus]